MGAPDATFNIVSETGATGCVIKLQGDIDLHALPRLRGALRYAISGRPERLIIDLTDAVSVAPAGLATLAAARQRAADTGTPLLLHAPNASTVELLAETGFDRLLPVVTETEIPPDR